VYLLPRLKGQGARVDEFAFVLLAGIILILVLAIAWGSLQSNPVGVSPTSKILTIAIGDSKTFTLDLNGTTINTSLETKGAIANWISFDKNNFDIQGSTEVEVTVAVPLTTQQGIYTGTINVVSGPNVQKVQLIVNVSTQTISNIVRSIRLGDFSVSYLVGSQTINERNNFEISKGYFSEYPGTLVATMTQDTFAITTGGEIVIDIEDTNGVGNFIVDLNGQEIYNQHTSPSEITITLDKSQILKSNNVVLHAGLPGFRFWMSTVYKIKSVSLNVDVQGVVRKDVNFQLTQDEVNNFNFGKISFNIKRYNPSAFNPLTVKINDAIIFDDRPTLFTNSKTFGLEVPLKVGTNTISFYVEQEAFYELNNVVLTFVRAA